MRKRGGYPLISSPLYKLGSRSKLAKILKISNRELRELQAGDVLYAERDIPKSNGKGFRHIENPARKLKLVQARLAKILMRIAPPEFLFCPVKGRSYVQNAAHHLGARTIRCLDIKNFFPNTPSRRVFWFFRYVMKCEKDIAGLITTLATYKEHLPTGSPLSPIMSYFAYFDLWSEVFDFCASRGLKLSVYIDDCTISGRRVTDADMWAVKHAIYGRGLRYHKEKIYRGAFAEVTGVILRRDKLCVPNRQFKKLRAANKQLILSGETASIEVIRKAAGLHAQVEHVKAVRATWAQSHVD